MAKKYGLKTSKEEVKKFDHTETSSLEMTRFKNPVGSKSDKNENISNYMKVLYLNL